MSGSEYDSGGLGDANALHNTREVGEPAPFTDGIMMGENSTELPHIPFEETILKYSGLRAPPKTVKTMRSIESILSNRLPGGGSYSADSRDPNNPFATASGSRSMSRSRVLPRDRYVLSNLIYLYEQQSYHNTLCYLLYYLLTFLRLHIYSVHFLYIVVN